MFFFSSASENKSEFHKIDGVLFIVMFWSAVWTLNGEVVA